ncbi:MAG: DUF4381 domain-containing protein [Gammaproteobacteria bacterium]|nr:DUF4381 domain-containing protein [Gammaproteobacteria bacterium]
MFDGIDPLSQLRDIHEPAAPLWPLSPAQWLLLLALGAIGVCVWRWWRARYTADPRRAALRELAGLRRRQGAGEAAGSLVAELAALLRRVALVRLPRSRVAGLCGQPWIDFLASQCAPHAFTAANGGAFAWAPYARDPQVDVTPLLALSESLIASLGARGSRHNAASARNDVAGRSRFQHLMRLRWRVRSACLANDAPSARLALLHWARLAWPASPPRGLTALAARLGDAALSRALAELDYSLYAAGAGSWQGRELWRRASWALKPTLGRIAPGEALPQLYG